MTRDELDLLTGLKRVCEEYPALTLTFPDSNLPLADEIDLGFRLLDIAYGFLRHARERIPLETNGSIQDLGDATAELRRQRGAQTERGLVIEHDDPNKPPSAGQTVLGDPDCSEG